MATRLREAMRIEPREPRHVILGVLAQPAMDDPAVRKRISDLGMDLPPAAIKTPKAFAAFHKAEVKKWYPIVKAAGVKAEQ